MFGAHSSPDIRAHCLDETESFCYGVARLDRGQKRVWVKASTGPSGGRVKGYWAKSCIGEAGSGNVGGSSVGGGAANKRAQAQQQRRARQQKQQPNPRALSGFYGVYRNGNGWGARLRYGDKGTPIPEQYSFASVVFQTHIPSCMLSTVRIPRSHS